MSKLFVLLILAALASYAQTSTGNRIEIGSEEVGMATSFRPPTGNGAPASANCNTAKAIASSTNASPIVITSPAHGFVNGNVVTVYGHATNTGANGTWMVGNVLANTFQLCGYWDGTTCQSPSIGNGVGGTTGFASAQVGNIYFRNDATAGQNLYYCTDSSGSPVWSQQLNSGAGGASAALSNLAAVNINTSLLAQTGVDLGALATPFRSVYIWGSGTYGTTSIKLTGAPTSNRQVTFPDANSNSVIPSSAGANAYATGISAGGVVAYSAIASTNLTDGSTLLKSNASNTITSGTQDFSGAAHTLPAMKGLSASKPATCTVGEEYFATDATAGQNMFYCSTLNTWTQQLNSGGGGSGISVKVNGGAAVGPQSTLNAICSTGLAGCTGVVNGSQIDLTLLLDTAYLKTNFVPLAGNCIGATCVAASTGTVTIAAGATTAVVATTAVTANSEIFALFDSSLGTRLGVTCNATVAVPTISARSAGVNFTLSTAGAPSVNPACYSWFLVN